MVNLQSKTRGDKEEHRWKMLVHMDGCHWYASTYICIDCSAAYALTLERVIGDDSYSAVWYDETGECARCAELLAGAEGRATFDYQPA